MFKRKGVRKLILGLAAACACAAAPAAASAQSGGTLPTITTTDDQVARGLVVQDVMMDVHGQDLTLGVIYLGIQMNMADQHPDWSEDKLRYEIERVKQTVDDRLESTPAKWSKNWSDVSNGILETLGEVEGLNVAIAAYMPIHKRMLEETWEKDGALGNNIVGSMERGRAMDYGYDITAEIVGRAWDECVAGKDSRVCTAFKEGLGAKANIELGGSPNDYLRNNPELRNQDMLRGLLDANGQLRADLYDATGKLRIDLQKLAAANASQYSALGAQISDANAGLLKKLQELDKALQGVPAWRKQEIIEDEVRKAKAKAVEDQAKAIQATIDGTRSATYLLSTFVREVVGDQKLASDINRLGNAACDIAGAVVKYGLAVAGVTNPLTIGMSIVTLTADLTKVATGILPMFTGQKPPPTENELIRKQLDQIQGQIKTVQTQMHDRFDRVDRSLNTIYSSLVKGFAEVDLRLARIEGKIDEVRKTVASVSLQLTNLERNVLTAAADTKRIDYWEQRRTALNYERVRGQALPESIFDTAEPKFATWAIDVPYVPAFTGGTHEPAAFADARVFGELQRPLEQNIGYLDEFARRRLAVPPFITDPSGPANPAEWAAGANSWGQLRAEAPTFQANGRAAQILNVGNALRSDLRRITDVGKPGSPAANYALFDALFKYYGDQWSGGSTEQGMKQWLEDREKAFTADRRLDPHGPADQPLRAGQPLAQGDLPALPVSLCSPPGEDEPPPPALATAPADLLPQAYVNDRYLALRRGEPAAETGKVGLCVRGSYVNTTPIEPPPSMCTRGCVAGKRGRLHLIVESTYEGRTMKSASHNGPVQVICQPRPDGPGDEDAPCPDSPGAGAIAREWNDAKDALAASVKAGDASERMLDAPALTAVAGEAHGFLLKERKDMYRAIGSVTAASQPTDVPGQFSGAHRVLRSFVELGLTRSLGTDEQLHALLYGREGIYDHELIADAYFAAADDLPAGDANVRDRIAAQYEERLNALRSAIKVHLDAVQSGTARESHPLIEDAMGTVRFGDAYSAFVRGGGSGGGGGGGGGGGAGGGGGGEEHRRDEGGPRPVVDSTAPVVSVKAAATKLGALAKKGLKLTVTVNEPSTVRSDLVIDGRVARKLGLGRAKQVVVGRGSARASAPGKVTLVLKLTKKAAAKLRRARALQASLRTTATDAAGNHRMVEAKLRFKR
jgi:hypothetical protein